MDFGTGEELPAGIGRALADLCRESVKNSDRFILVDRESMVQLLGEEDFTRSMKCDETRCLIDYGKKLRAQLLWHGRVTKVGQSFVLTLKVLDIGSAEIVAFRTRTVAGQVDNVLDVVAPCACELLRDALQEKARQEPGHG